MNISAETILTTEFGDFAIKIYQDKQGREHVVLSQGDLNTAEPVVTRLHSECITGEVFHSIHCDCGPQLNQALKTINQFGRGLLLYLRQEGRDIGLTNKIKAYELQRQGMDTIEANKALGFPPDARRYDVAAEILRNLGVVSVKLLTNNPNKVEQLTALGIVVAERVPLEIDPNGFDDDYLRVKKNKMGHWLTRV